MWTGKQYRLSAEILGMHIRDGRRVANYIPRDAVVKVIAGPSPDSTRLVEVLWNGAEYTIFSADLVSRGELVKDTAA